MSQINDSGEKYDVDVARSHYSKPKVDWEAWMRDIEERIYPALVAHMNTTLESIKEAKADAWTENFPPRINIVASFTTRGNHTAETDAREFGDQLGKFCDLNKLRAKSYHGKEIEVGFDIKIVYEIKPKSYTP